MRRLSELYAGPRKGWYNKSGEAYGCSAAAGVGEIDGSKCSTAAETGGSDRLGSTDKAAGAPTEHGFLIPGFRNYSGRMLRINILAMGDVGGTLALAMKLTGADIVSRIGICDISEKALKRWEQELNQIAMPSDPQLFPLVEPIAAEEMFDCDVFVFCASRGVPDVSQTDVDVRMVQLEKNLELVRSISDQAVKAGFDGEFFIVSDPVDPLCAGAVRNGIPAERVQGFGLGVMNGRAAYFARLAQQGMAAKGLSAENAMPDARTDRPAEENLSQETVASDAKTDWALEDIRQANMAKYLTEGRVFGPHGEDLVVANSVIDYNEEAYLELTRLTVEANLRIRELGYKPYIAPAVTSGALSILENLRGNWQYSSAWFGPYDGFGNEDSGGLGSGAYGTVCGGPHNETGAALCGGPGGESNDKSCGGSGGAAGTGAFLGMRNRRCEGGLLVEDLPLDERLFARIQRAYRNLENLK